MARWRLLYMKKTASLALVSLFLSVMFSHAANVAWISFHPGDDTPSAAAASAGFTMAPDVGYTELLRANGHEVTRIVTSATPDAAVLNDYDVVIIGRSVPSGNYQDAGATAWNSISAPVIVMGGYVMRNSRMGYTTGGTIPDTAGTVAVTVNDPSHPIFQGISLGADNSLPYANIVDFMGTTERGISVNTDPLAGGGVVLGTVGTAGDPAFGGLLIGEWQSGAVMGNSAADVLAGHRLVFLSGSREHSGLTSEGSGIYDLNPESAQLFLNAVRYMAGETTPGVDSTVVLLHDGFNSNTGNTSDLNEDLARQTGSLAPLAYTLVSGPTHYGHQLQNPNAPDQLLLADFANSTVSPNQNFNGVLSQNGLKITIAVDPVPADVPDYTGIAPNQWGAVNLGLSQANQLGNVNQAVAHFGILFRGNGMLQAFDGNTVVSPSPEPVYSTQPVGTTNVVELVITDTDGNPFDGVGATTIDVYANGGAEPVYTFTKGDGGYTDNYINLQGNYRAHFDSFEIAQFSEPEPVIVNPSFEADTFTLFPGYVSGNGPITGWNAAGGAGINPADGSPFANNGVIPDGTQVAFIQDDSALSQMVSGFIVGRTYQLTYFENARDGNVPVLEVRAGGNTIVAAHTVTSVGGANPYVEVVSDPFVADAETMEIAFVKTNPAGGDNTVLIDHVGFLAAGTPPTITTQPSDQMVGLGDEATFTVGAFGSAPLSYQWFFGSESIPGATGDTLVLPVDSGDQAGEYSVEVSNAAGSAISDAARLTVRAKVAGLFNTGVDENGDALADGAVDPHYTLTVNADSAATDAIVHDSTIFPIAGGPWMANTPDSKWIAPKFNTVDAAGLAINEGRYVYSTTFDLTGVDIPSVVITGGWAMDNNGVSIRVNGESIGQSTSGFAVLTPFTITSENANLVDGINTLDFEVVNADAEVGYTALRVGNLRGFAVLPETPAGIVAQPQGGTFGTGEDVVLSVTAEGSSPVSYQWFKDGVELPGENSSSLTIADVSTADGGEYTVSVSNPFGEETSEAALLIVRASVPGLFNTGVDDNGMALPDGAVDPHYEIVGNPDATGLDAIVEDSTVFPILPPAGPWIANTPNSKWIGPRLETSGSFGAPGDDGNYIYRLQFDMTGLDPATVSVSGEWTSDNAGIGIRLNGQDTGISQDGAFGQLFPFMLDTGFVDGLNTLEFIVNNSAVGYTGLRVQNLRGLGEALPDGTEPFIVQQPESLSRFVTETASFEVRANGSAPVEYQWYFFDFPLPGETGPSLSFLVEFPDQQGEYSVEISNAFGSVRSDPATLTVATAPTITQQPQSQVAVLGDVVVFNVAAIGEPPLGYQWQKDGNDLPGEDLAQLIIDPVTEDSAGVYTVIVANFNGLVLSDEATLTLAQSLPGLFNTGVDDTGAILPTGAVDPHWTLAVSPDASVPGPNAIVVDDQLFPIVAGPWLPTDEFSKWIGPQADQNAGNLPGDYTYRLTFDLAGFDPATVQLTGEWSTDNLGVDILINGISTGQDNGTQFVGWEEFTVTSGFQPGLNTLDLIMNNAGETANPTAIRVRNLRGVGAMLPDGTAPSIVTQPVGGQVDPGGTATFEVAATGTAPLSYQWYFNDSPIPGETEAVLSFLVEFPDQAGAYSVEVSNPFGSVRSDDAILTVLNPNVAPSFTKGPDVSVDEDAGPVVVGAWATNIDPGAPGEEGQTLTFLVSNDQEALFAAQPAISADGTLSFTPAADASGVATVEVALMDDGGTDNGGSDTSAPQSFLITIAPIPDAPVCTDGSVTVDEDAAAPVTLTASDADGDTLTFTIVAGPAHGSVSLDGDVATYLGNPNFCGMDSFTFMATDPSGLSSGVCTVSVTVHGVNDAPTGLLEVSPSVDLGDSVSGLIAIAADNEQACVTLDASGSSDPDAGTDCGAGDIVSYTILDAEGNVLASGPVVEICLPVGSQSITLLLDDGEDVSETVLTIEVLTPSEAVEELVMQVEESVIERGNKRPFLATLKTAGAAFDRGQFGSAINRLERAFQNKVRAQVGKDNPDVAEEWIRIAQEIIDAVRVE